MRRLQMVIGVAATALLLAGGAWYGLSQSDAGDKKASTQAASTAKVPKSPKLVGGIPSDGSTPVAPAPAPATGGKKQLSAAQKLAATVEDQAQALATPDPYSFRIASFNILGSQHTVAGGQRASMASGSVRAGWAAGLISSSGVDVVGFGEMQRDQYAALMSRASGFASYPGTSLGGAGVPTTLIWRTSRFDLVDASYLQINFLGMSRLMPIVLLKEKASGRTLYVFNVHNSPVQGGNTHQGERNVQMAAEIATIKKLRATGRPVFFIGDMNEHAEVLCKITGGTDLTSPAGSCRAPGVMRVDWIFGNGNWTHYELNRSALVRRVTDHTVLFADVTVP